MNCKGTLHVGQRKDYVCAKILYDSSYFMIYKCLGDFGSKKVKETKEEWMTV